jgi:inner membrane protein
VRLPLRLLILLGHRGLTHSLVGCVVATGLCWLLAPALGAGVAIGFLTHVAADACTPSGVPLFAPLSGRKRHLLPRRLRVPTGSWRELAVAAALIAGTLAATLSLV